MERGIYRGLRRRDPVGLILPNVVKTTAYTLKASDINGVVEVDNANPHTLTVPPQNWVAFPIGGIVEILRYGSGSLTITPGTGVTLRHPYASLAIRSQFGTASLRKRAHNEWVVVGDFI